MGLIPQSKAGTGRQEKLRHPTRPAEDVVRTMEGLQERTQVIECDDRET